MLNVSVQRPSLLEPRIAPIDKLLALDRLRDLYHRATVKPDTSIFEGMLRELRVTYEVAPDDLVSLPRSGAVVIVANHPFGMLEGIVLGALLSQRRKDVRILANHLLAGVPALAERLIFVDPFESRSVFGNTKGLREAIRWLASGGVLLTFPAGEVSHWDFREGGAADPPWSPTIARLLRMTHISALPVFFRGGN